jgi:dethiobiotin synthetase
VTGPKSPEPLFTGTDGLTGVVVVTGTDTGVGKTIVTAAIAAAATAAGRQVAMVKPAQTGIATGEEADAATVARLADPATVRTLAAYPDPLAPLAAARVSGQPPLKAMTAHLGVRDVGRNHDLTLVEGAGGLLVQMGEGGWTIAELAVSLGATVVVVARAGLGTLNHVALTLEALDRRGIPAYVVIGAWPAEPELVHRTNMHDLRGELAGVLPEGAGTMAPTVFRREAPHWLSRVLHGDFNPEAFRTRGR